MYYSKPVQDAVNYINQNLLCDIALDSLAKHVNFSPYHFHRMFLFHTRETPMEYIRRQRIRRASAELLAGRQSILEIALKFRFDSQDGFCRAFKKYFGITPGEYRKLNFRNPTKNKVSKEKRHMYTMDIYSRLVCSNEDKRLALGTMDKLLRLSAKAKISGLLSLETEIDLLESDFFKKALQLLIDGVEQETIKETLLTYSLCENHTGKELLTRILVIEGTIAIQEGVAPAILREKLSSFFGDSFIGELNRHFGTDTPSQLKAIENFISEVRNKSFLSKETSLLEEPLGRMDNRSLQRLLREIDGYTLAKAMSGASGKIQVKVIENVSRKMAVSLIEAINNSEDEIFSHISDCQRQLLEVLRVLNTQGDVVI